MDKLPLALQQMHLLPIRVKRVTMEALPLDVEVTTLPKMTMGVASAQDLIAPVNVHWLPRLPLVGNVPVHDRLLIGLQDEIRVGIVALFLHGAVVIDMVTIITGAADTIITHREGKAMSHRAQGIVKVTEIITARQEQRMARVEAGLEIGLKIMTRTCPLIRPYVVPGLRNHSLGGMRLRAVGLRKEALKSLILMTIV